MSNFARLKQHVNIKDVVEGLRGSSARCPFHGDNRASMVISEKYNTYKCMACGESGDVIDYWANLNNISIPAAAQALADKFQVSLNFNLDGRLDKIVEYQNNLTLNHIKYLRSRGIEDGSIKEFKIGAEDNYIMFPIFDVKNNFAGFIKRQIDGEFKGKDGSFVNVEGNLRRVRKRGGAVYLCEGYIDCIQAYQEGINAVCAFGATFSQESLQRIINYFNTIVLAFDEDDTGFANTIRTWNSLKQMHPFKKVLFADFKGKDIGEHLLDEDEIPQIDIVDWCYKKSMGYFDIIQMVKLCQSSVERRLYALKMAEKFEYNLKDITKDLSL